MEDVKLEFAKHLASIGFELNAPQEVILDKLRRRMGEQRFHEVCGGRSHGTMAQERFYTLFTDIVEGNLMRSLDPGATLESSFNLYQRCAGQLRSNSRVIELGCWTGGLASFIAMRHPRCSVVGVDFAKNIVDA